MNFKRLYECENCGREVSIRSTIKDGDHKGKKVCGGCRSILTGSFLKSRSVKKNPVEGLDRYFDYHISACRFSEESGKPIPEPTVVNVCHIFPKRAYPSIAGDLENVVYLTWQEHHDFDKLLDQHDWSGLEREFPNCWYDVCVRAANLTRRVTERGKLRTLYEEYLERNKFL